MSIHAINAALEAECGSAVKKIVLLVLANYANEKNSCFPSKRRISRMGNISEASVKRAIKELREMGFIEIRERYQSFGDKARQTSNEYILKIDKISASNTPREGVSENSPVVQGDTGGGAQSDPPITITNNQNINPIKDDGFCEFWDLYPKSKNTAKKKAALSYFVALKKIPHDHLILATNKFRKRMQNVDPQYVPMAQTWLNQERWIDAIEENPAAEINKNRIAG